MASKFDLSLFRMGYILAYMNDNSFISNKIYEKQLSLGFNEKAAQVVHVEVSGGGAHSINIHPPTAKLIDITKQHKNRYAYLLRFKNSDYQKKGRYKVAYFSASLCNTGYDIAGVLSFLYKWIKQNNRLYFCSEGVAWSLRMVYPEILPGLTISQVMPAHFMESPEFEIEWAGFILESD